MTFPIPIPSLAKQRLIVAELDAVASTSGKCIKNLKAETAAELGALLALHFRLRFQRRDVMFLGIQEKVKMLNVIIICFGFSAVVLISYFLMMGQISSTAYSTLFLGILLGKSLALYGFDRLRVFDLKNLMFSLDEIKEVRERCFRESRNGQNTR